MTRRPDPLVVSRTSGVVRADPRRVVAQLFVPGQETLIDGHARIDPVIQRILDLPPEAMDATLQATLAGFTARHPDLPGLFQRHYDLVSHRLGSTPNLSPTAQLLIGAYFTHEYAVEAAAVFNPSIVAHPDQTGLPDGALHVILSLRSTGEGHLSSIEFRTGTITASGELRLDDPGPLLYAGRPEPTPLDHATLRRGLAELSGNGEDADYVLAMLPDPSSGADIDTAISLLRQQRVTRRSVDVTIERLRTIAQGQYTARFPTDTALGERVLMPVAPAESHGVEDARFVRFTEPDGTATYHATYTAYDGTRVKPRLLSTADFQTFRSAELTGPAAANKGMALFPRRIAGRYTALTRWDRENTSVARSDDLHTWSDAVTIDRPGRSWDLIQIGNCGSPIETAQGWLVLTHGVGAMRAYAIGAVLLDIDDPTRVIGRLGRPLLSADEAERDGYVPNVVYTCGAVVHGDSLVMPYGYADSAIGVAVIDLPRLLAEMTGRRQDVLRGTPTRLI